MATDRPRAGRRNNASALIDREAGYYREMTRAEMAALLVEIATLLELDLICEGKARRMAEGARLANEKSAGPRRIARPG